MVREVFLELVVMVRMEAAVEIVLIHKLLAVLMLGLPVKDLHQEEHRVQAQQEQAQEVVEQEVQVFNPQVHQVEMAEIQYLIQ